MQGEVSKEGGRAGRRGRRKRRMMAWSKDPAAGVDEKCFLQ